MPLRVSNGKEINPERGPVFRDEGQEIVIADADKDQRFKIGSAVIRWLESELNKIPKAPRIKMDDPNWVHLQCKAGEINDKKKLLKSLSLSWNDTKNLNISS